MAHTATITGFLEEQSVGSVLRSTFRIFFRHFPVLAAVYLAPILPFVLLEGAAAHGGETGLGWAGKVLVFLFSFLSAVAVTVAVSDVCRGNRPRFRRSYRRAFGSTILKGLPTYFAALALISAGTLLFIVPGLILGAWLLFVLPIVVIEESAGMRAFRRSKDLGRGFYARNLGIFLFTFLLAFLCHRALATAALVPWFLAHESLSLFLAGSVVFHAFGPLYSIAAVLLYYDMRVRKESIHLSGLLEEIRI